MNDPTIVDLPCRCEEDHGYTRNEAEKLNFICDIDGKPIVCAAPKSHPKSSDADD
jgi:hypothetical protein